MNYYQIKNQNKEVYPAIILDSYIPESIRNLLRKILLWIILGSVVAISFFPSILENHLFVVRAYLFFLITFYIAGLVQEFMYRSYYFTKTKVDIRVLKILHALGERKDITTAFLQDELGMCVMRRLGFTQDQIRKFIKEKTDIVTKKEFEIIENDNDEVSFAEFGISLMHFDSDLKELCRQQSIMHIDFKQTLEWVARVDQTARENKRWWTRENLLRIPSLGKNLSFGKVYHLERLGHNMLEDTAYVRLGEKYLMYQKSVRTLETILSQNNGGNIMLTARESYVLKDILASLTRQIKLGKVLPAIENKRLYVLETNLMISNYEEPDQFERAFYLVLTQASNTDNVILVLPDFAELIVHANTIGVDVKTIIREALQSRTLHIIATSNEHLFHQNIETDIGLMNQFEKIHVPELNQLQTISVLADQVVSLEKKYNVYFTYQAIKRVVENADRYFADMSLLDKGLDILNEIVLFAQKNNYYLIASKTIDELMRSKKELSIGVVSNAEAHKLAHIKENMIERVVGQDQAIESIVGAMMRARAGFADPQRPLASFLFVGPTGVGKTEMAKVLADLFFGDENQMLRSDMNEYVDHSAIKRIIGDSTHAGVFATKIREKRSGVLLLDEFEKASPEVHNLFLQIINEGFFVDGRGERVNMRNFIIIATSHVDNLSTELRNGFDDIIIFNQLSQNAIEKITHTALVRLTDMLDSRGITLKKSSELIQYLVTATSNSQFGAREISRIIKKEIESKIAQALVLGDLFEGDTISLTVIDNKLEIQKYS